jgi:poly-beta-hydroxybutyrate-responsive repressor
VTDALAIPKDFLRACLLLLLRECPAHGYDLIERARVLGVESADPGRVYRTLRRLEADGLVRSAWEPSGAGPQRRMYELTRAGGEELHRRARSLRSLEAVLEAFLSRYEEFVAMRDADGRRAPVGTRRAGAGR